MAKCLGTAGLTGVVGKDVGCAQGLLDSSALPLCPVTVLTDNVGQGPRPVDHVQCHGVSQRQVTKGTTVTRHPGREGQAGPCGRHEALSALGPWALLRCPKPHGCPRVPGDLPVPLQLSQSPLFTRPGVHPGPSVAFSAPQSPASLPWPWEMAEIYSRSTQLGCLVASSLLFLLPNRKSSCRKEGKQNEAPPSAFALLGCGNLSEMETAVLLVFSWAVFLTVIKNPSSLCWCWLTTISNPPWTPSGPLLLPDGLLPLPAFTTAGNPFLCGLPSSVTVGEVWPVGNVLSRLS